LVDSDEDIIRKIDELSRDPKKWDAYMASRMDKALDDWPTRARRRVRKNSSRSS
jgi:hypothetical protein